MSHVRLMAALAVAAVALGLAGTGTARAEFFGCNDRPGKVLYDSGWHSSATRHYAGVFASQPRRVSHARVTYSGAQRYYGSHYR